MEASRRGFLGGMIALASAAVVPASFDLLPIDDRWLIDRMMREGETIRDKTFVFRDGLPIFIPERVNFGIHSCKFIWIDKPAPYYIHSGSLSRVYISDSVFRNEMITGPLVSSCDMTEPGYAPHRFG